MATPSFDSFFLDVEFVHDVSLMAQRALQETKANGVAIALRDGTEYVCRATAGVMAPSLGVRLQNDTGITAACIRAAEAVVCSDAASDERVNAAACQELGIASLVVVPIKDGDTVTGIIEALSEKPRAFGAAEQAVLAGIARDVVSWTPGQVVPIDDGPTSAPDIAELMNLIEGEQETTVVDEPETMGVEANYSDVVPEAEQGTGGQPDRFNLALLTVPLAICVLAALLVIFGRIGTQAAIVAQQRPASSRTLPAAHTDLHQPSPPPAANKKSGASIDKLEVAARAGDASAQVRLASALAEGAGAAADPVSAEAWYIVAHLAGNNEATAAMNSLSRRLSPPQIAAVREQLATMYANGIGVRKNRADAYFWLTLAEAAGAPGAAARKHSLESQLGPSQIAEANVRAQEWLTQHHQLIAQDWNP